jgi:hypothetical protein
MAHSRDPEDWPTEQFTRPIRHPVLWVWCGQRPWLAALLTVAGGLTIALVPNAEFSVVILPGVAGLSGLVLGTLVVACGLFLVFSPQIHGLIGIAAVLLSLVSFVSSNLGGLIVGMLLGVIGGSLGFGWHSPARRPR